MKYLKAYESLTNNYFTQEEVDDISDIFRDMVDEFDMIYYDNDDDSEDYDIYLCYRFIGHGFPTKIDNKSVFISNVDKNNLNRICVKILFPLDPISKSKISSKIDFDKVIQYKDQFINRLKQMGYDVNELLDFNDADIDTIKINISKKK